jgi:hypothetical protein
MITPDSTTAPEGAVVTIRERRRTGFAGPQALPP